MNVSEWRAIGVFGAVAVALSLVDGRLAMWLVMIVAVVAIVRNSEKIARWAEKVQG